MIPTNVLPVYLQLLQVCSNFKAPSSEMQKLTQSIVKEFTKDLKERTETPAIVTAGKGH